MDITHKNNVLLYFTDQTELRQQQVLYRRVRARATSRATAQIRRGQTILEEVPTARRDFRPTGPYAIRHTPIRPYAHTPIRPYAHTPYRPLRPVHNRPIVFPWRILK